MKQLIAVYKRFTLDPKTEKFEHERVKKCSPGWQSPKENGVMALISDKIDVKSKKVTRDKEGHDILIRSSTQQEDKMINIHIPTDRP